MVRWSMDARDSAYRWRPRLEGRSSRLRAAGDPGETPCRPNCRNRPNDLRMTTFCAVSTPEDRVFKESEKVTFRPVFCVRQNVACDNFEKSLKSLKFGCRLIVNVYPCMYCLWNYFHRKEVWDSGKRCATFWSGNCSPPTNRFTWSLISDQSASP